MSAMPSITRRSSCPSLVQRAMMPPSSLQLSSSIPTHQAVQIAPQDSKSFSPPTYQEKGEVADDIARAYKQISFKSFPLDLGNTFDSPASNSYASCSTSNKTATSIYTLPNAETPSLLAESLPSLVSSPMSLQTPMLYTTLGLPSDDRHTYPSSMTASLVGLGISGVFNEDGSPFDGLGILPCRTDIPSLPDNSDDYVGINLGIGLDVNTYTGLGIGLGWWGWAENVEPNNIPITHLVTQQDMLPFRIEDVHIDARSGHRVGVRHSLPGSNIRSVNISQSEFPRHQLPPSSQASTSQVHSEPYMHLRRSQKMPLKPKSNTNPVIRFKPSSSTAIASSSSKSKPKSTRKSRPPLTRTFPLQPTSDDVFYTSSPSCSRVPILADSTNQRGARRDRTMNVFSTLSQTGGSKVGLGVFEEHRTGPNKPVFELKGIPPRKERSGKGMVWGV